MAFSSSMILGCLRRKLLALGVYYGRCDLGEGMVCCMYLLAKYLAYLYKA